MSAESLCASDDASFEQDLSMLLDDELVPARDEEVRRHLDGCAHCRNHLAAFRRLDRALGDVSLPEVPEWLQMTIWDAIESNRASEESPRPVRLGRDRQIHEPIRSSRFGPRRWAGSALVLAASLAIYFAVAEPSLDLEHVSDEELAVALEFDTIRDLEVITNLELVERLVAMSGEAG